MVADLSRDKKVTVVSVIPAKAGIHLAASRRSTMDPGFRRDDDERLATMSSLADRAEPRLW
jgi:hypothetical protein